ncbi:MAG: hypothetical protein EOP01_02305, partial [Propionibacteriaceae bacterium]
MVTEKPPMLGDAALPLRVVPGTDRVRILVPGWAPVALSVDLLEAAFALGLRQGPASVPDTPAQAGWAVDSPTRFMVGRTDIGVAAGMRAVRYGLHALAARLTTLTDSTDEAATTASEDGAAESAAGPELPLWDVDARRRAALAHARNQRTPEVFVEVADLEAEFDRYFALVVEHGTPLTLTRAGHSVALMVPFE